MRSLALAGLVTFVCLSLIFGTFLIARVALSIAPSPAGQLRTVIDVLRVVVAVALAYVWLRVWKAITDRYFWRSVNLAARGRDRS